MPARRRPRQLQLIEGTFRPDRAVIIEAKPKGALGNAPAHFDGEQRALWTSVAAEAPPGLLTGLDRSVFGRYIVLLDACMQAETLWNMSHKQLMVRSSDRERTMGNPYLREIRRLTELLRMLESEMGFSPASRSKIDLSQSALPLGKLAKYIS